MKKEGYQAADAKMPQPDVQNANELPSVHSMQETRGNVKGAQESKNKKEGPK